MSTCTQCEELRQKVKAQTPRQLSELILDIRNEIAAGVLAEDDFWPRDVIKIETGPFGALPASGGWPDVFVYYFRCTMCKTLFKLSAETYHGSGGSWKVADR